MPKFNFSINRIKPKETRVLKGNKATGCGYYWRYKDEN
jgi:hypothetical protein